MISTEALYNLYLKHRIICTDTRKISDNSLFFALKGDQFDGNTFASKALEAGAAYAVVDNPTAQTHPNILLVEDVLTTLQDLAKHHRKQLNIPVIGLTGSNGKTTTKELLNAVLSKKYITSATVGNLNNHIGVPLTILNIAEDVEIAIVEMGANHQLEIAELCSIAMPTHGLITNVGKAHLEGFGGFEGVKIGKGELYAYLADQKGETFLYRDNQVLNEMSALYKGHYLTYGAKSDAVSGSIISADPYLSLQLEVEGQMHRIDMQITGAYNFENVMAAAAVGHYFGVASNFIKDALIEYKPTNNRSQIKITDYNTVICDFYNANPSSMRAAIENLSKQKNIQKVAILGDMFELGAESEMQHQSIIDSAYNAGFTQILFVGKTFLSLQKEGASYFESPQHALEALQTTPIKGALILLKGSRGMALEQLLPAL